MTRIDLDQLEPPEAQETEQGPVTDEQLDAALVEREQWLARLVALKRAGAVPRRIEIASSRERAQGPLAAEVATFDAALVLGQGPPVPIGDAVHMVMECVNLPRR